MVSMLKCVLAGAMFTMVPGPDARWQNNYGDALRSTRKAQRPLLVVLDEHDQQLSHIEPVSQGRGLDHTQWLDKYTLCHIDVTTPYGRAVAKAFRAQAFPTTVIIDKSGSVKLTTKVGKLSDDDLHSMLVKHQNGERPAPSRVFCRT